MNGAHFPKFGSEEGVSLVVYSAALALTLALTVARRQREDDSLLREYPALRDVSTQSTWFTRFITACFACRVFWLAGRTTAVLGLDAEYHSPYVLVSLANRLSSIFFFAAFSTCSTTWAGIAGASENDAARETALKRNRVCFLALNLALTVATTTIMGIRFFTVVPAASSANLKDIDYIIVALLSFVVAVSVAVQGRNLHRLSATHDPTPVLARARRRLLLATLMISGLCALRAVLFAWAPVTGSHITGPASAVLYPWFFYVVPEVVCGVAILIVMWPRHATSPSALTLAAAVRERSNSSEVPLVSNESSPGKPLWFRNFADRPVPQRSSPSSAVAVAAATDDNDDDRGWKSRGSMGIATQADGESASRPPIGVSPSRVVYQL